MGELKIDDLIPTSIESFFQGVPSPVDVYIQLSSGRFIMLMKAGDTFQPERLRNYQDKNVAELYILRGDHAAFVSQQITIAGIVITRTEISKERKASVITQSAKSVFEHIDTLGFSKDSFESARQVAQSVLMLAESKSQLTRLFEDLNKLSAYIFRHSIAVGIMSPMIAQNLGWARKETLEKLCLGGFLHDIGKKEIDPRLFDKPRSELTFEELKDMESHAFRGMQLLNSINVVPDDIVAIVYEHHENSIGQGYPRHLWEMKTNPMARVVCLANAFCELIITNDKLATPKTPQEALTYIEKVMGQPYNKEAFRALKTLVNKES